MSMDHTIIPSGKGRALSTHEQSDPWKSGLLHHRFDQTDRPQAVRSVNVSSDDRFLILTNEGSAGKIKVYRSSAEAGKTWQLAFNYILMTLQSGVKGSFKHIIAVTFTNKATREMKDRILRFLRELAEEKHSELSDQVIKALGLTPEELKNRAGAALKDILHNYAHFSVSTIDAFFQRIIRAFAKELGLLGNYQLELDQQIHKFLTNEHRLPNKNFQVGSHQPYGSLSPLQQDFL